MTASLPEYFVHMDSVWLHLHSTAECESVHFHGHRAIEFLFVNWRGVVVFSIVIIIELVAAKFWNCSFIPAEMLFPMEGY